MSLPRLLHHFRGHKNVCGGFLALCSVTDDFQITCLYDMDIVFQPSGNFDEVYLYVRYFIISNNFMEFTYF